MLIFRHVLLLGLAALSLSTASAQALLNPPPPPASAFEREIAAIDAVAELERRSVELAAEGRYADQLVVLKRLESLQPKVGRHRFERAATYAQLGEHRLSYDILLRMHGQGYAFDLGADKRFENVSGTRVWDYLVANYEANRAPFGSGSVAFELAHGAQMLESMAWDERHGRWLFGSMRSGAILARNAEGNLQPFIKASTENGLWSVLDLKVDAARGKLWVASAAMPFFAELKPQQIGMSGLFRFDLDSGKLERRWLIPPDGSIHALSSIALGRQGEAYVLDGVNQAVYLANEDGMRGFFSSPKLQALRAMVVSDDGNRLYVADYDAGILVIDLTRTQAYDLIVPESLTLDGIESLHMWRGQLVLVQTGTDPAMRVMRLVLSENGRQVMRAQPIDANHAAMSLPVAGAVRGDHLYFIANSQKGRFGSDFEPEPVRIFQSDLTTGLDADDQKVD